jgi:hypothetical protein
MAAVVGLLLYSVIAFTVIRSNLASDLEFRTQEARAREVQAQGSPALGVNRQDPDKSQNSELLGSALLGVTQVTPERNLTGVHGKVAPPPRKQMGYLLPFEIVSVHLLVVLIGAAYLARAKRRRGAAT